MVEMFFDSHKARQTRRPHGTLRPSTPHQRQTTRPHGHNPQPQTPIDQTIHVPRERGCESRGRRWQNGIGGDGGGSSEGDSGEGEGTTRADEAEARAVAPNSTAGSLERHRPPASPAATTMSLIPNLPASSCRCARRRWPGQRVVEGTAPAALNRRLSSGLRHDDTACAGDWMMAVAC